MTRRRVAIASLIAAFSAIAFGALWAIQRLPSEAQENEADPELGLVAARVLKVDLFERETLDGTLRYADPGSVLAQAQGTITGLPEAGTVLDRGSVAYELDGLPVVVMFGDRPAWRPMTEGVEGTDVAQLAENLDALGFFKPEYSYPNDLVLPGFPSAGEFLLHGRFTDHLGDFVEEWQESLGLDETGTVELGRVVFLPGPVRVADLAVEVGSPVTVGTPVIFTSAQEQDIQLWLDADRQDLVAVGDSVGLEFPDEFESTGVVVEISRVVTTLGTGPETRRVFEVTIRLDDPAAAAGFDEAPVDIEIESIEASDVLAVPVKALLALAEGGYAVEVQQPDGGTRFVAVDIGSFADGLVEVTGDLREGDVVFVPQ